MAMTIVEGTRAITGGVDTHLDVHVAAALDPIGGVLGVEQFSTSADGERELLAWLAAFGAVERVGVEGHRFVWREPGTVPRREPASRSSRSTGRTAKLVIVAGSPIQ